MSLDLIIFLDLYLTLRNPFYPRKKRIISYHFFNLLVMLIVIFVTIYSLTEQGVSIETYKRGLYPIIIDLYLTMSTILMTLTTLPLILSLFKLKQKGMSSDLKTLVVRRFVIYYCCNLLFFLQIFLDQLKLKINERVASLKYDRET